jgi:hypothetical protein
MSIRPEVPIRGDHAIGLFFEVMKLEEEIAENRRGILIAQATSSPA